jgi:hypothetical protein
MTPRRSGTSGPRCRLSLGTLYRRVGRLEGARAALATAISVLRDMGMAHWLPEAEGDLATAGL